MQWKGVMPAITTPFDATLKIDHQFLARHARWLQANGCTGIVCLGSLGEAATLDFEEKLAIVRTVVAAMSGSVPVVGAVSALSTAEAVHLAKALADSGVLVAIASKNEREVVDQAMQRSDLRISSSAIYPLEVHWEPMSA